MNHVQNHHCDSGRLSIPGCLRRSGRGHADPGGAGDRSADAHDGAHRDSDGHTDACARGEGDGTVVPILTPFPSPEPVPDDWAVYTDPEGRFTVRYPPTWSANDYSLYSFDTSSLDPDTWSRTDLPSELIEVEMGYTDVAGSGGSCGGSLDQRTTGEVALRPEAAPATLGGVSGGQIVRVFADSPDGLTRIHGISVIYQGYCFNFAAYFCQENPDEATFLQIASSFKFADFPAIDQKP